MIEVAFLQICGKEIDYSIGAIGQTFAEYKVRSLPYIIH